MNSHKYIQEKHLKMKEKGKGYEWVPTGEKKVK